MPKSVLQLNSGTDPQPGDVSLVIDTTVAARATDGQVLLGDLDNLTSASAPFLPTDTGKYVTVQGGGPGGTDHVAIATYISASTISLDPAASQATSDADVTFTEAVKVTLSDMWKVVNAFTTIAQLDSDADWIPVYDSSESAIRRVSPSTVASTSKHSEVIGDGAETEIVVTHNLNTRAILVSISETSGEYNAVTAEVEKTSLDTITCKFAEAPAAGSLRVTVLG